MTAEPIFPDEPVDLSNCDREPIHLLGHVQPFGFLVAVSADWIIQHVSANVRDYLGVEPESLPGSPLTAIFPADAIHSIRGRLQMLSAHDGAERLFGCDLLGGDRFFDVAVHVSGASIVIEAEPAQTQQTINPGALVKSMIARIQKTADLDALFRESVRQLRGITGFDRVMLYRFAGGGSGEVIAESLRSGLDALLGLNYPATDIPRQARALYVRNQTRIIADVDAAPVPILPAIGAHDGQPIDLSLSLLRSVSPIHIEYLKNMRVSASFSISIVIDGRLWGLFALHHYAPRQLSMELRAAAELFGQMVAFLIEGRVYREQRTAEEAVRALHDRLIGRIVASAQSLEALADFADELRQIVSCDGLVVWSKGAGRTFGRAPTADELPGIARFLNRTTAGRVYASAELSAVYPSAADFADRGAGLLAIPISRVPRDYLLFFRRELVETVNWAGDPSSKETAPGPNGPRLAPRRSFEAWQETVRGKSRGWTESDVKAAEALRVSILEILLRFNEETERQQGFATQRQELLIAELNHRVRNILSLMRAIVAQSKPGAGSVDDFARIIGGRIQALARAHDQITSDNASATLLRDIVETEVGAYVAAEASRVRLAGPDIVVDAKAFSTLALVFHEMVTNSAKYGALSDAAGTIDVAWRIDENEACAVSWRERGGPLVRPPQRRGFGSTIIERSVPHDLGGEASIRYALGGFEADFRLPPSVFHVKHASPRLAPAAAPSAPAAVPAQPAPPSLEGLRALVVEDNMLISLDAEAMLLGGGAAAVFVAASVADARRVLGEEAIGFALLDVNLGSETSFPLVASLLERGIPFAFATGYGERIELPTEARRAATVKKPYSAEQLLSAVAKALGR